MGADASDTGYSKLSIGEAPGKGSGLPGRTPTFRGMYILIALTGRAETVGGFKSQYVVTHTNDKTSGQFYLK